MSKKTSTTKKKGKAKDEVQEIKDDLGDLIAIHSLYQSEGGQLLVTGLVNDVVSAIDAMSMYASDLTHPQLIMYVARIKERMDLVRVLTKSKKNRYELEDILREKLKEEEDYEPQSPQTQT